MIGWLASQAQIFAAACGGGNFFGFPTWHKYLDGTTTTVDGVDVCTPKLSGINDVWSIGLALIEILLRVAILAAIVYVMLGGFKYVTARGNADKLENAKTSIIDAMIGLVIAIAATAVVAFIAGRFTQ